MGGNDNNFEVLPTCWYRCQACASEETSDDFALPFVKDALITDDLIAWGKEFLRGIPGRCEPAERLHMQHVAWHGAGLVRPNIDEAQVLQFFVTKGYLGA